MNIYLVSRTDKVDYNEHSSYVVISSSKDLAKSYHSNFCWGSEKDTFVELIGTAIQGKLEGEIIDSSFHAG